MDINATKQIFREVLSNSTINSRQIHFIDTIINFLSINGTFEPSMLFELPFSDINSSGIMGLFDHEQAGKIIELIERVNRNAEGA